MAGRTRTCRRALQLALPVLVLITPKTYGVEGGWELSDQVLSRSNRTTQPWYQAQIQCITFGAMVCGFCSPVVTSYPRILEKTPDFTARKVSVVGWLSSGSGVQ